MRLDGSDVSLLFDLEPPTDSESSRRKPAVREPRVYEHVDTIYTGVAWYDVRAEP